VDAIVVGLGSMGSSAAYHLAARGLRVVGLDRFAPPHGRGAHAGGSRIIRTAYMEDPRYVPLVHRAFEMWRALERDTGEPLLTLTGGLMLGRPDSVPVAGALAAARAHGLVHELLDPDQVRARFPAFTPADDEVALYEEAAGLLRPERAIEVLLALAKRHGAELRTGQAVRDWSATSDGVRVTTDDGVLTADRLILAPGAWAAELLRIDMPMRVRRRVQHFWLPAAVPPGAGPTPAGHGPADFEPERFPVWIWDWPPDQFGYGLPAVEGAVKAALHLGDEAVDPDAGADEARPDEVAAMRELMASRLPALACGEWLGAKPCLYTLTPDEHFLLGAHPFAANTFVAAGFSGHGFKFVPVVGEILADLAVTGTTPYEIDLFDPARPTDPATAAEERR
jgi:sarcosine oxidase